MVCRTILLLIVLVFVGSQSATAEGSLLNASERGTLRDDWHRCVREAYAVHVPTESRVSAQRSALLSCKNFEDAYVSAELAARQRPEQGEKKSITGRAREWAASVAAYVVDPVTSLVGSLIR